MTMKRLALYAVLLATAALRAASVYPNAASNYIFSTPGNPTHIRGEVMGDPPAYYVPRAEDADWLFEAVSERAALRYGHWLHDNTVLVPEFGKWDLAATNRFSEWVTAVDAAGVTNVIIGYNLVTNSPGALMRGPTYAGTGRSYVFPLSDAPGSLYNPLGDHSGYLSPDAQLITSARTIGDLPSHYTSTNAYVYSMSYTNTVTNAMSTIEMPMKDGTVSVYTNTWTVSISVPVHNVVTSVVTLSELDFCHTGDGAFPGYTNAPPWGASRYGSTYPAAVSNSYVALRGARRLAEGDLDATNTYTQLTKEYYDGSLRYVTPSSPKVARISKGVYATHPVVYNYKDELTYEAVETTESSPSNSYIIGYAPTRFDSDVVTTGGVRRVSAEKVFLVFRFYYERVDLSGEVDAVVVGKIDKYCFVPIQGGFLDTRGRRAVLEFIFTPNNVFNAVTSACGAPPCPQDVASYDPGANYSERWNIACERICVIYRTSPTSKFVDW